MALRLQKFVSELVGFRRVGIDSSTLIYHLDDRAPYSDLTEAAFSAVAAGRPQAVLSTISVTELLVKPYADGDQAKIAAFEQFLATLPNTALVAPGYAAAKDAARLRARYGIRVPDALLVATARGERAEAFLTNDGGLRRLRAEGIAVLVLDDYL